MFFLNIRFCFLIIYSFYRKKNFLAVINNKLFVFPRYYINNVYVSKKSKSTRVDIIIYVDLFFFENRSDRHCPHGVRLG